MQLPFLIPHVHQFIFSLAYALIDFKFSGGVDQRRQFLETVVS